MKEEGNCINLKFKDGESGICEEVKRIILCYKGEGVKSYKEKIKL
jgi:hypothetical protein